MMNRFALCTLLITSSSGLACSASHPTDKPGRGATAVVPAENRGTASLSRPTWESGKHYQYRLKTSSRVFMNEAVLYDFDLTGLVNLVLVARDGEKDSFQLTLGDAALKSRVPGTQKEFDQLLDGLKRPFFFELEQGLASMHYLPGDVHPLVAAALRSIAASLQLGHAGKGETFRATEYDTTGRYLAEYSPAKVADTWIKRKERYLGILLAKDHPKEAERVVPQIEKSEATIRIGSDHVIAEIRQVDELSMRNAGTPLRSHVDVSLVHEGTQTAQADANWREVARGFTALAADAPFMSASAEANLDQAKTQGLSYEAVTRRLEALSSSASASDAPDSVPPDAKEHNRLFIALGAVMRTEPESVTRAVKSIRDRSVISDTLVDALGSADAQEAQAALAKLAADKTLPATLRNRAAISLSRTSHPTIDSANALLALVEDEVIGTEALYGIGAYCKGYQASGQLKAASMLGDYLVRRLAKARSELRLSETLRAIANSAYLPALDAVRAHLKDPRNLVRVDAAGALQAMQSPSVDPTLVDVLEHDSARAVKVAAIEAMGRRAPSDVLVAGLSRATVASDPHVRYRSVEVLTRWLPQHSEVRETIRAVAENDREEKIRSLARKVL